MNTAVKLGGFGIGLAAVFTAALGLGHTAGPIRAATPSPAHAGHASPAAAQPPAGLPAGLQISQDGYRLTPLTTALSTGAAQDFRFQITGPDNRPVTSYTASHDKDLHLI